MAGPDPSDLSHPIVQAPMAGGPSTPELAGAVSEAGGLGFLAAALKDPDAVRADIAAVRALTPRPFGLNLFLYGPPDSDPEAIARYAERLRPEAERLGVALGEPRHDDERLEAKLALAIEERVPLVSFTFGCPPRATVERLHDAGAAVWVTVASPEEAAAARDAGADAVVAQGTEAGGHRAYFDDSTPTEYGLLALLRLVVAEVDLPVVAAGGLGDREAVAGVLAAGAAAAQLGTAFMLAPEAGTSEPHRRAIRSGRETVLTRAFSGRTARGVVNRFAEEHSSAAPRGFPEVHHLTAPLRAAARERGDADGFHLWAGQAHALAEELPAAELVRRLSPA